MSSRKSRFYLWVLLALAAGYQREKDRRWALAMLMKIGTEFNVWSRHDETIEVGDHEREAARWFNYPGAIVTATGYDVSQADLGRAIHILNPTMMVLRSDTIYEQTLMTQISPGRPPGDAGLWRFPRRDGCKPRRPEAPPRLRLLLLEGSRAVTLASLEAFASLPNLQSLELDNAGVTEKELSFVTLRLPRVKLVH